MFREGPADPREYGRSQMPTASFNTSLFYTCNETGRPLELFFGVEKGTRTQRTPPKSPPQSITSSTSYSDSAWLNAYSPFAEINCTIDYINDPLFHLLEFYIHNDAPLTCRIPSRPLPAPLLTSLASESQQSGAMGTQSMAYSPLIIALTGTLQFSHLHVSNYLNLLLHAAPRATEPGVIDAATAYSVSHTNPTKNTRIIIGDPLTLQFSVRWYPSTTLPSGWTGVGGHLYWSTLVYCALSAGAATAVCIAWFRGVELPRRLKSWKGVKQDALPRYSGYGYGVGTGAGGIGGGLNGFGNGFGGTGKRD